MDDPWECGDRRTVSLLVRSCSGTQSQGVSTPFLASIIEVTLKVA